MSDMQSAASSGSSTLTEVSATELAVLVRSQAETIAELKHRLAWFERQLFGQKSERLKLLEDPRQMMLGEVLAGTAGPAPAGQTVAAHVRRPARRDVAAEVGEAESVPFFDASRVPVEVIEVALLEIEGLTTDQYEVIGTKRSYRLAQRPGSYVVIEYVRKVIKRKDIDPESGTSAIVCAPAPAGILEGSRADVSFLAGLLLDKFRYHLPLYRQHQRLIDAGITVSRPWLTQLTQSAIALLAPIYEAQLASIRMSRVIAMDETPIKAGRSGHGKMKTAYFWPLYGEHDEVCFPYRPNRNHEHVASLLGGRPAPGTVLHTDGYAAYESYAKAAKITHAQCWAHCPESRFIRSALAAIAEILGQRVPTTPDNIGRRIRWRRGKPGDRAWGTMDVREQAKVRNAARSARARRASFAGWWSRSDWSSICWHGRGNRGLR
jgi:transposase